MITPSRVLRRIRSLLLSARRNREVDEELEFHVEMESSRLVASGYSAEDARAEAVRRFGNRQLVRETTRDSHGTRFVEDLLQDIRFGARTLSRQRVFASVAVLTLAVGIGATTAIFGAVHGVLLAPLPYSDTDRIMTLWQASVENGERDEVAPGNFLDWQQRLRSFSAIAAAEPFSLDYVGPDGPERFENAVVTSDFFRVLDATPLLGRSFATSDFEPGQNAVVIISESVWRSRFGADSAIVGRTLILDSMPRVVIGVMPAAVDLPNGELMWTPKVFRPDEVTSRTASYYTVVGRLAAGVTPDAAAADMRRVAAELAREYPATNARTTGMIIPLEDALFGNARRSLWLLLGAVTFVLLIACANVASLQLSQAVRRQRELAIRASLGAGRNRLGRQLITESLLLSFLGGLGGVAIAAWGLSAIRLLAPIDLPRVELLELNGPVLAFAVIVSIAAAVIFGALPMLQAGRMSLAGSIGSAGGTGATHAQGRRVLQRMLVGGEIALALTLLIGAGLLVRSFVSLTNVDRGFTTTGVVNVTLQAWGYYPTGAHRVEYVREAIRRLQSLPGIERAAMTSSLPLSARIGQDRTTMVVEGQDAVLEQDRPTIHVAAIAGDYTGVLGIRVVAGRMFNDEDRAGSMPVTLVNEAFVRRFFPSTDPIGKRVTFGFQGAPQTRTIVGVVGDMRHEGLQADAAPGALVPHAHGPTGAVQLVALTTLKPVEAQRMIRAELAAINGAMPLSEITSLDARLSESLRERRFHLGLLAAFSATALFLATIGVYGMMSQATSERTREIGVRVALGAQSHDVVLMVLRHGLLVTAAGLSAGCIIAVTSTRLMRAMLFRVEPLDAITYAGALLLITIVAGLAAFLPARRAATIDPIRVLRDE